MTVESVADAVTESVRSRGVFHAKWRGDQLVHASADSDGARLIGVAIEDLPESVVDEIMDDERWTCL